MPTSGRTLPGMPLEMVDPDDDSYPAAGARFSKPRNPWWRPAGTTGRVLLGFGALLVVGSLATSIYLLKTYLGRDSRFRIVSAGNIQATGLTEVSRAEMLPVFGEDIGRNIFFIPLADRRKQLEDIPWVEHATVMRVLPDQIRVSLIERNPVAFVRQGQQVELVDSNGVLLEMPAAMMAQHHYSFPVVTGLNPQDPPANRKARMASYQRLLSELDSNGQRLSEQISEIDLTDSEDARVLMPEQGTDILAHFGADHFLERYQRYKAHIAEWRQQYPNLAAVDLRYEQQVVLEMAHGASAVQPTQVASAMPSAASADAPPATQPDAKLPDATPSKPRPGQHADAAPAKPADSSHAPSIRKASAETKLVAKAPIAARKAAAIKALTAKDKAARDKKKRTEARRAALHAGKQKPASTTHRTAAAAEGQ